MLVNEIFYSIQGEGLYSGIPMVFVRLQGCNLAVEGYPCSYCDTKYAQKQVSGLRDILLEEILTRVLDLLPYRGSWVCITGGEPLRQESELEGLVRLLKKFGYSVEIETNGTLPIPQWYTLVDSWVADIKCPCSGPAFGKSLPEWLNTRFCDQIKFVVDSREDLDFAGIMIKKYISSDPLVFVSPVLYCDSNGKVILDDGWLQSVVEFCKQLRVRMGIQQQKIIWGNRRGV